MLAGCRDCFFLQFGLVKNENINIGSGIDCVYVWFLDPGPVAIDVPGENVDAGGGKDPGGTCTIEGDGAGNGRRGGGSLDCYFRSLGFRRFGGWGLFALTARHI